MSPVITFAIGLLLLVLFFWYFATDQPPKKRILGTALTVLLSAFCVWSMMPMDKRIRLGLDLKGGTSFLIQLASENGQQISKETLDQAVEVIRKRVDQYGVGEPVISPACWLSRAKRPFVWERPKAYVWRSCCSRRNPSASTSACGRSSPASMP